MGPRLRGGWIQSVLVFFVVLSELIKGEQMTVDGFCYDVFLSHSSKDKTVVRRLAERLRGDGIRVWLDEWEIRPGDSIPRKIDEGLEQSAALVLCMSAASLGSDWVTLESQAFRFTDPVNRNLRFIPLRLDDTEPRQSLRQFAYVDWRGEGCDEAYSRLLSACKRLPEHNAATLLGAEQPDSAKPIDQQVLILEGHTDLVSAVAISASGECVVSSSNDKTVRVWDLGGTHPPRVLEGHTEWRTSNARPRGTHRWGTRCRDFSKRQARCVWF
jgi:hypothetical protein